MPKASPLLNSFNAGELSPLVKARQDLEKYQNGCETLENFIPTVQGAAVKRPGFRYVTEVKNSAHNTRLIPFEFSTEQAYILEFGDQYIRFYKDGGQILHIPDTYVTNGQFDTDISGWTDLSGGTGSISHDAADLRMQVTGKVGGANFGYAEQAITTVVGVDYELVFDSFGFSVEARVGTGTGLFDLAQETKTAGTGHTVSFTATGTTTYIGFRRDNAGTADIDNVDISTGDLVTYEITSPYLHGELADLHFTQSADVLYIAHPDHPPYKLGRTGHTSWNLTEIAFAWPPFSDENTTATTVTASATTGTGITLLASTGIFESGHVGTYFKFSEVIASKYNQWETGKVVAATSYRWYDGNLYYTAAGGTTGTRPPIHTEGTESDGGITDWLFVHDGAGYVEIASFVDAFNVTADVIKEIPQSATAGTTKWAEGAWSDYKGWPRSVAFYEDRLWWAGSDDRPQTLWASTSGDYENHKYGTEDDDALNYTINSQEVNVIRWLVPGKYLAIGTTGGEYVATASRSDEAITPTNVRIVRHTTYGGADSRPFSIGNAIIFLQRAARKVRELVYQFENDSFVAPDLTRLAEHITSPGIGDLAYQQEPDRVVWGYRTDGVLIGMTYERPEAVVGWHRHDVNGSVKSLAVIPHWDGTQDVLWMIVERTIDGSTVQYIEYMEKHQLDTSAFYIDSGLSYSGASTTTLSGLDHLEGETVAVLANGAVQSSKTVVSGSITLDTAATTAQVGLPMTATLKTMPTIAGAKDGTALGKTKRINNVTFMLKDTGPGLWYGPDTTAQDELHFRSGGYDMDSPVPLLTGLTDYLAFPGEYDNEGQITVQHKLPYPCTLVAILPQVTTNDR